MINNIKVSVIVPIYNVEEYLRECLDSLVNQTLKEIEIIMVNDGSTDSSGDIAKEYENKYTNFYLINKINGGLGQARNYGVPYAKGEYIAFVDSDDIVTKDAYEKMYKMAKRNNSDIVIGNVKRFNSKKEYDSVLHTRVFKEDIEKTTIRKNIELIYDTTAWNKIFHKEFWLEYKLSFPEGILYEDIPVTIPAHFLSKTTSVLSDVIYYWRERDGITRSITQERTDITNFTDRLYGLKVVDKFIEDNIDDEACLYAKYYKWLDLDLKLYINKLDQVDEDYLKVFLETICEYLKTIPTEIFTDLRAIDRIKYYFIQKRDIDSLIKVLNYEKNHMRYLEVKKLNNKYFGKFPFDNIPTDYFDMTHEFNKCNVIRKLEKVVYSNDVMYLKGYFYIPRVSVANKKDIELKAKIINLNNNKSCYVNIENVKAKGLTQRAGVRKNDLRLENRLFNYDWCGYEISIDLDDPNFLALGQGKYKVIIELNLPGINREVVIGGPIAGKTPRPKPYLNYYNRMIVKYNKAWDFVIDVIEEQAGITNYYSKNNKLYFEGWFANKNPNKLVQIIEWKQNIKFNIEAILNNDSPNEIILHKYPDCSCFTLVINKSDVVNKWGDGEWFLNYYKNGKREVLLGNKVINKKNIQENSKLFLDISQSGAVIIKNSPLHVYLKEIKWIESKITLIIAYNKSSLEPIEDLDSVNLKLSSNKYACSFYEQPYTVSQTRNTIDYTFEINTLNENKSNRFPADLWAIDFNYTKNGKKYTSKIDLINNKKYKVMPLETHKYKFISNDNNQLALNVLLKWGKLDKGPRRREALERYIYPIFQLLPIKNKTIIFESYWGDKYNCNPRYLYEYISENHPEYECIWSMSDESLEINGSGKKVRIGSLPYYYYMARSKYFVNNVNFPDFHKKRKKSIEIQTMHGTPLKTLGLDIPNEFKTNEGRQKFIDRCKRWDYLIVSSDKVEQITRRCFAFDKKILKTGYPRIDKIFEINTKENADKVKSELNIPKDKKVVLYAPTWRVKNQFDLMLDLEKMKRELGNQYILLLRLHPFSVKGFNRNLLNDFVIDVTNYEDIESLYVVSDVLITDYSSVMFDYAVLDKPMIFFTYDLEVYKNNLRGFNLDFEKEAPGPIVFNSDEVTNCLKNLNKVKSMYKSKFKKFKRIYCQYEKGLSCEQVFNEVFRNN